jgi:hypothetical protein
MIITKYFKLNRLNFHVVCVIVSALQLFLVYFYQIIVNDSSWSLMDISQSKINRIALMFYITAKIS